MQTRRRHDGLGITQPSHSVRSETLLRFVGMIIAADLIVFWLGASLLFTWAWVRAFGKRDVE